MDPAVFNHIILSEHLCFFEGKTRITSYTEKSKFLSNLALLLNGYSTRTAVYVHQADKMVFIARNDPITSTEQRYFDRFFRLIRIYTNLFCDKNKESIILKLNNN